MHGKNENVVVVVLAIKIRWKTFAWGFSAQYNIGRKRNHCAFVTLCNVWWNIFHCDFFVRSILHLRQNGARPWLHRLNFIGRFNCSRYARENNESHPTRFCFIFFSFDKEKNNRRNVNNNLLVAHALDSFDARQRVEVLPIRVHIIYFVACFSFIFRYSLLAWLSLSTTIGFNFVRHVFSTLLFHSFATWLLTKNRKFPKIICKQSRVVHRRFFWLPCNYSSIAN